jgi:hypothetical protein
MLVGCERERRFGGSRWTLLLEVLLAGVVFACLVSVPPTGCSRTSALPEISVAPGGETVTGIGIWSKK